MSLFATGSGIAPMRLAGSLPFSFGWKGGKGEVFRWCLCIYIYIYFFYLLNLYYIMFSFKKFMSWQWGLFSFLTEGLKFRSFQITCWNFSVCEMLAFQIFSGWWFQIFFIFTPIWGRFPFWLIFFKWVGSTTNQFLFFFFKLGGFKCCDIPSESRPNSLQRISVGSFGLICQAIGGQSSQNH